MGMKLDAQLLSKFVAGQFGKSETSPLGLTSNQSLRIALTEGLFSEMSRAGRRFAASPGVIANAQAPVVDMPTTAAAYALYNGETGPQAKSYVIDAVTLHFASGTAGAGGSLIGGVATLPQAAAVANGTGVVIASTSGSSKGTKAKYGAAVTLAGAPAWIPLGGNDLPTTAGVGAGQPMTVVPGFFIVPAGFCFGMHILAPAGTAAKFSLGVIWHEIEMDLE